MSKKNEAHQAQKFAQRLIAILSGKTFKSSEESYGELIIGFIFFFGGIWLLFSYFTS